MNSVHWNIAVSPDTHQSVWWYLAVQGGGRKADLSRFIEDAVRARILALSAEQAKAVNANVDEDYLVVKIQGHAAAPWVDLDCGTDPSATEPGHRGAQHWHVTRCDFATRARKTQQVEGQQHRRAVRIGCQVRRQVQRVGGAAVKVGLAPNDAG